MRLQIRDMQAFDLGAVMAVERASYQIPWSEMVMSSCLGGQYRCEVAFSDAELVGHMVSQLVVDEMHLLNICVATRHQRCGVGLALLQHLLDSAKRLQVQRIILEVRASNEAAKALYEGFGFAQIGLRRGYYRLAQGREDGAVMAMDI